MRLSRKQTTMQKDYSHQNK